MVHWLIKFSGQLDIGSPYGEFAKRFFFFTFGIEFYNEHTSSQAEFEASCGILTHEIFKIIGHLLMA